MTRDDLRDFVAVLHEPSAVTTSDGRFEVVNDAFRQLLREFGSQEAQHLHAFADKDRSAVDAFLGSIVRTRPAIQGRLTVTNGEDEDHISCFGGVVRPGDDERETLLLLRFYRSHDSVQRFRLLGRKINELNVEVQRRRKVEVELREIRKSLERRVEERTADLERANLDLVRSNESLEEFAYVASHDLREPLRKITVFCGILRDEAADTLSDQHRSILSRMFSAAERMDTLIESLLAYSRVSTSGRPFEDVDLTEVVYDVLSDLEVIITETNAEIDVGDLPVVKGDETQMRQLFQNLVSNSLKFRRPDRAPRIRLTTSSHRSDSHGQLEHVIEISDNGIGFDQDLAENIFDPFHRLHTREEFEGTGIGLAVCRRIVQRHGGSLTAFSAPGDGATFRIVLPAGDAGR